MTIYAYKNYEEIKQTLEKQIAAWPHFSLTSRWSWRPNPVHAMRTARAVRAPLHHPSSTNGRRAGCSVQAHENSMAHRKGSVHEAELTAWNILVSIHPSLPQTVPSKEGVFLPAIAGDPQACNLGYRHRQRPPSFRRRRWPEVRQRKAAPPLKRRGMP
jgi:hypothetical protein